MCTWYSRQLRPTTRASVSSEGEASCGGVVRLEAGVKGTKDGSPLLLEPRLFCGMSGGGGKGRDAKRAKALQIKKQQMEARIQEQIESWFLKFDADGNNALDKEELRNLLTHLHPEKPADDAALENLMQMAGGSSSIIPDGQQSISKEQCMKVRPAAHGPAASTGRACPSHATAIAPQTVQKYNCYLKDRIRLDELFATFDKDGAA